MPPRQIDPAAIAKIARASRSSSVNRSTLPDSVKLQALAAAVAKTKFQQTGQGADDVQRAQERLNKSIEAIAKSDAPAGSKKAAAKAGDTKSDNESFLTRTLNVLGKPKTAVVAGVARLLDDERNFLKDLRNNVGTADVLANADWFKNLPTAAKIGIGIAGDIAADPLTYLVGSGVITKAGGVAGLSDDLAKFAAAAEKTAEANRGLAAAADAVGGTKTAARALAKADEAAANARRATDLGGNLLRKGQGGIGGVSNADLKWIGEVTGLAEKTGKPLKAGVYFQTPLTGRFANYASKKLGMGGIDSAKYQIYLGRGPLVQAVSAGAANKLADLKTSKLFSEIGEKYGGSTGKVKRAILNASTPEEALRTKAVFAGQRAGDATSAVIASALDNDMQSLYKMAKDKRVEARLGGVLDGNIEDIQAVDSAVGMVKSSVTGEMVPFSQRLREFDNSVIELSQAQIERYARGIGVDPETLQAIATVRDGHYAGMLTDEARQMMGELGALDKASEGGIGLQGFQNQSKYVAGQTFNDVPIASPQGDLTHVVARMDGKEYVLQPKNGEFVIGQSGQEAVDEATRNLDGSFITNNDQAAAKYLESDTVQKELAAARKRVREAKTPQEKFEARQSLARLQARHEQESRSLMRVRVQRNGNQEWMIVPTSRMEARTLPQSRIGPRTQVNQISMDSNGFPMFNMDWGTVGSRQISQAGNAVKNEVLAATLRQYGSLGGLRYAADLGVPESVLNARAAIEDARGALEEAKFGFAGAQSATQQARLEALQLSIDKADEIASARDRLLKIIQREGKLSSTPKRKQLAELEFDLEMAMRKVDIERAALARSQDTLRDLNSQLKVARQNLAEAKDAAAAARAQAEVKALEEQVAQAVPEAAPAVDSVPTPEDVIPMPEGTMNVPDPSPLVPDQLEKAQADFGAAVERAQQRLAADAAPPSAAAVTSEPLRTVDATERELMYAVQRQRDVVADTEMLARMSEGDKSLSVYKTKQSKPMTKAARLQKMLEDDRRLLAEAEKNLADYRTANGLDSGSQALDDSVNLDRLNADMLELSRNSRNSQKMVRGTSSQSTLRGGEKAASSVNEERAFLRERISELRAKQAVPEAAAAAPSPETLQAQRVMRAKELADAEPEALKAASDYERLMAEATNPNGNVDQVFESIKAENARQFTPEMKASVANAVPEVSGDVAAQTALRNPEIVAEPDGVAAIVAASKAKEEAAAAIPIEPAAGRSVLEIPEDQFVREAQAVLDDLKGQVARQKQYGTKNRASRLANREAEVAQIEQDWIALDEKIRVLDEQFAAETARRGAAAKEELSPLMEQIIRVKEAVRVAKDAEVQALKVVDSRVSELKFAEWMKSPIAEQEFLNVVGDGWRRLGRSTRVPDEVADIMALTTKMYGPDELPSVFRIFDKLTTLFKKWAIASPGFITRNGFGGMFNNWLGGVDAGRYSEFLKADHAFFRAQKAGASIEDAFNAIRNPEIREGYRLLHTSGVLAETDQAMDAAYGLNRTLGRATRSANDIGVLSDNPVTRSVYKANHRMERVLRGAAGLDAAIKTGKIDQIYDTVFKLHFNYSDLNRFEVNVMKRVSPFYAWTRFNLPLQMEMLVRNPKVYNHYNIFAHNIERSTDPEDVVPTWMRDRLAIRLPFTTDGGRAYMLPDLPLNSLQLVGNLDELGGQINPVIKTPIEMALDRKLYFGQSAPFREGYVLVPAAYNLFGKPLELAGMATRNANGDLVTRDKYLYAIEQFMPFVGRARRLLPDEKKYQDRLPTTVVNFLFGAGLRTNTESDKLGELSYRQRTVDRIAKDLNTQGYGGYVTWDKQVTLKRKPEKGVDKVPYLTLISPKGGLGANSPYTNVPTKMSTGQMLAALKARQA